MRKRIKITTKRLNYNNANDFLMPGELFNKIERLAGFLFLLKVVVNIKIRINKHNKDEYISTLTESLERFIKYCNEYENGNDKYTYYKNMAENILSNYNSIALNVLQFCFDVKNIGRNVYPGSMLRAMYDFRDYAYDNLELLSIGKQQEKAKNYVHFDFSVKKPKTLIDI